MPITSIHFRFVRICRSQLKSSYLKNKKHFLGFLFHFWNLHQIWNIFKKRKMVIANGFPKLATVQCLVTPLTIQGRLKTFFDSQHVKRFQTLVKCSWEHFYHIFWSLCGELTWKISPWLKFWIIGLLVNRWTAHYEDPVPVCKNLPFTIQIQLSSKQKNIFSVFYSIYGISIKFWTFSKKKKNRHS